VKEKPITSFGRMSKSKYYYDYTRNMSEEQIEKICTEECDCVEKKNKLIDIFKDDNNYNEKSIVGFIAFAIMIFVIFVDVITGFFGKDLVIKEFVYNSFVVIVLGSFGISGVEKIFNKK
tara:strand:+ start:300 stop:656 length:357 start_codon:yes stop_codon:yes gene_type:complete